MDFVSQLEMQLTRRLVFQKTGAGLGAIALASLLANDAPAAGLNGKAAPAGDSMKPRAPHFAPKAKRVISLHMIGAPSQLELFDNKPELIKHSGKECPAKLLEGKRFAFLRGTPKLLGTRFKYTQHGQGGIELSELLPNLATVADDIAVVKTLHTEEFNHGPAQLFMQTGFGRFGRPCLGSWVTYGLGSENENLPGFVVLLTGKTGGGGSSLWGSGFLPTVYQGIQFRTSGDPVLYLSNPPGIGSAERRRLLDAVQDLNRTQIADVGDPEIATRIAQYEMAYRMQTSVPELMSIAEEPAAIREMYGAEPGAGSFANNCLLARRLVERGVRFVQLYDADWDHHGNVFNALPKKCKEVDQLIAALIKDLKQRGLLDDTLIVWGGEFGRTPMLQGNDGANAGRDHHKDAYCVWMAGGGVKGGTTYGKTDDLGYYPVENPMHVNDFHATILHLLGMDHEKLTFKFQGRQFRLTDVAGKVAKELIA